MPGQRRKLAGDHPFGSYRPGEEFRDYPFQPTAEDLRVIRREMRVAAILS